MRIVVAPTCLRMIKKLHGADKIALDAAVTMIAENPLIGDAKVGDLAGVRVFKFRMANQLRLLAYR